MQQVPYTRGNNSLMLHQPNSRRLSLAFLVKASVVEPLDGQYQRLRAEPALTVGKQRHVELVREREPRQRQPHGLALGQADPEVLDEVPDVEPSRHVALQHPLPVQVQRLGPRGARGDGLQPLAHVQPGLVRVLHLLHPVPPPNPRPDPAVPSPRRTRGGAARGDAEAAAGGDAVAGGLRVLGGGGDAEEASAQAQVDEGDDPRRGQVRGHQGQAAGAEAAHRLRGGALPQPRRVLVGRRDRNSHCHHHDPR